MLVLKISARDDEVVMRIAGKIVARVTVEDCRGGWVRLGFVASADIEINRLELDMDKYPEDYAEAGA